MDKVTAAFKVKFAFDKMVNEQDRKGHEDQFNKMDTDKNATSSGEFGISKAEAEAFYDKKYGGRKAVSSRFVKKLFKKDKDDNATITLNEYLSAEHFEVVYNSVYELVSASEDHVTTAEAEAFFTKSLELSAADSKAAAAALALPSPCSRADFMMKIFDLAFPVA
ncbi:uncharacterized protein LOC135500503 [Lineus longissimus]|uniref:uncharacterized protein LOC135500503 n=1 Tax=Lineus longissimus TaxID=88925 RepID=UPI002B4C4AB9